MEGEDGRVVTSSVGELVEEVPQPSWTIKQLRDYLRKQGVLLTGRKAELLTRYVLGMPSDGFERLVMAVSESLPIGVVLAIAMKILVTAHLADITTRRSVQEQKNLWFSLESNSSRIV